MHIGTQHRAIDIRERGQAMLCHSCRANTSRICRASLVALCVLVVFIHVAKDCSLCVTFIEQCRMHDEAALFSIVDKSRLSVFKVQCLQVLHEPC